MFARFCRQLSLMIMIMTIALKKSIENFWNAQFLYFKKNYLFYKFLTKKSHQKLRGKNFMLIWDLIFFNVEEKVNISTGYGCSAQPVMNKWRNRKKFFCAILKSTKNMYKKESRSLSNWFGIALCNIIHFYDFSMCIEPLRIFVRKE